MDSLKKVFMHQSSGSGSSSSMPRLERLNALRNSNHSTTTSLDNSLNDENEIFRLTGGERNEHSIENILNVLGVSRLDMLGIPAADWARRPGSGELTPAGLRRNSVEGPGSVIIEPVRRKSIDTASLSRSTPAVSEARDHVTTRFSSRGHEEREISEFGSRHLAQLQALANRATPMTTVSAHVTPDNVETRVSMRLLESAARDMSINQTQSKEIFQENRILDSIISDDESLTDGTLSERAASTCFSSSSTSSQVSSVDTDESAAAAAPGKPPWCSWKPLELLGRGSFGSVYKGVSSDGIHFAVKQVSLRNQGSGSPDQQCITQLEQEIAILSDCQHENIVQYLGTERDQDNLYIFLELVTEGSLASMYKKYTLFDGQIRNYTRQILCGLNYLHQRNRVHRDIKCANILVHAHGTVKLADFGMAKQLEMLDGTKSTKGSVYWMAPEVIAPNRPAGLAADIWSLGCSVLEMATGQIPFSGCEWVAVFWKVKNGEVPAIPDTLPEDLRDFISQCLKVNPSERSTAAELLRHRFVNRNMSSLLVTEPTMRVITENEDREKIEEKEKSTPSTSNEGSSDSSGSSGSISLSRTGRSVRTRRSIFTNSNS